MIVFVTVSEWVSMFGRVWELVGGWEDGTEICPHMNYDGVENNCLRFGMRERR